VPVTPVDSGGFSFGVVFCNGGTCLLLFLEELFEGFCGSDGSSSGSSGGGFGCLTWWSWDFSDRGVVVVVDADVKGFV
jgi:hypothetical protein